MLDRFGNLSEMPGRRAEPTHQEPDRSDTQARDDAREGIAIIGVVSAVVGLAFLPTYGLALALATVGFAVLVPPMRRRLARQRPDGGRTGRLRGSLAAAVGALLAAAGLVWLVITAVDDAPDRRSTTAKPTRAGGASGKYDWGAHGLEATSPTGSAIRVNYQVVAFEAHDGDVVDGLSPSCRPPAGSAFRPGTWVIECAVTGSMGQEKRDFTLYVYGPGR